MNQQLIEHLGLKLGANGLPYQLPIHPNLVHFTLGLFIIAIIFDIAGVLFFLERPILKFLALPAVSNNFFDVGWYNVLASAIITFLTVAMGFFEIMLADPPANLRTIWGLSAGSTMLLHGVGGVLLLAAIASMAVWRGLQRFVWRKSKKRQVQWSYLLAGVLIMGAMYVHGTLGAKLGGEFAIHNTAGNLVKQGKNPNVVLK